MIIWVYTIIMVNHEDKPISFYKLRQFTLNRHDYDRVLDHTSFQDLSGQKELIQQSGSILSLFWVGYLLQHKSFPVLQ